MLMSCLSPLRISIASCLLVAFGCTSTSEGGSEVPAPADALPALVAVPDAEDVGRIVDADGREVLLRGVNVNAHIEYWQYDPELFTTYPFIDRDADMVAAMGWNMVRLGLSWSRVEPEPGEYDEEYLDELAEAVAMLRERGVYTLMDLHQDPWSPHVVAPPDQECPEGARPTGGWDGAPEWALFDDGLPRCEVIGAPRELIPVVQAAWRNFMDDVEGPGGVGIRTRYAQMFGHLVARFAQDDSVVGYEVINEPALFEPGQEVQLTDFYEDCLAEMRAAEDRVGAPRRLFFFEPSVGWNAVGLPAPPPFDHDDQVVYAPHIYQGGIDPPTLEGGFARAAQDSTMLYGGAPVVTTEWGSGPDRAKDPEDDYFERHLQEQDSYRFGAAIWTWREACGDAHKYNEVRDGKIPEVWGFFEVDCETNTIEGERTEYRDTIQKMALRFAPGALSEVDWAKDDTELSASGDDAPSGNRLEVFVPTDDATTVSVESTGLGAVESVPWFGGTLFYARAEGGSWSIRLTR